MPLGRGTVIFTGASASIRGKPGLLNIDAIAETYRHLHRQLRSAWTQEVDLRPFKETF